MKILVTGGCGFIGSHVVDRFYKEGHKIYIIDNLSTGVIENVKVNHRFYNLDISDKKCEEVFKNNMFDVVIHLSAQIDVKTSIENPYIDAKSNILGLINMLDLSSKYGVKKFIFASSAAVYGDIDDIPLKEEIKVEPLSPYGMSKYVGELYCIKWGEIYGLNTVAFRFSNVYGPRQGLGGESGVVSRFIKRAVIGKELIIYGDGSQTRDFIYVEDLVEAIYKSVFYNGCCHIMNISNNTEVSLNKLIEVLSCITKISKIVYKDRKKGDILRSRLNNSKAKQYLSWNPKYSFEEGIKKTYDWYEKIYS